MRIFISHQMCSIGLKSGELAGQVFFCTPSFLLSKFVKSELCDGALSSIRRKPGLRANLSLQVGQRRGQQKLITYLQESTPLASFRFCFLILYFFPRQDCVVFIFSPPRSSAAARSSLAAFNSPSFKSLNFSLVLHSLFSPSSSSPDFAFHSAISFLACSFSSLVSADQTWNGPFQFQLIIPQHITDVPCFFFVPTQSSCHCSPFSRQTKFVPNVASTSTDISSVKAILAHSRLGSQYSLVSQYSYMQSAII